MLVRQYLLCFELNKVVLLLHATPTTPLCLTQDQAVRVYATESAAIVCNFTWVCSRRGQFHNIHNRVGFSHILPLPYGHGVARRHITNMHQ